MMRVEDDASCIDANYHKGLLANQERTGVYEEIYRPECGGGTTDIARPIKARYGALGNQSYVPKHKGESSGVMDNNYRIRKLTPRECFRLQGWTDDYFEKAQFVNSDSQLYKQAGNGVTVNVIEAIAKRFEGEE